MDTKEKEIKVLKSQSTKQMQRNTKYQEAKKAISDLQRAGLVAKPQYNLKTIDTKLGDVPVFKNQMK